MPRLDSTRIIWVGHNPARRYDEAMPKSSGWKRLVISIVIPLVRQTMRYVPPLRRPLWERLVNGHLHWRDYKFVERTHYGMPLAGSTVEELQRFVYYLGRWEPHVEAVIAGMLRTGDTFIDIGANVGYFTLLGSKLVGASGKVVAIEACSATYQSLLDNLKRNKISNVRTVQCAVSDRDTELLLHSAPDINSGLASLIQDRGGEGTERVHGFPLGSLLSSDEIRSARLIKIDVEGAEKMVLEGMMPILRDLQADLVVEINPDMVSSDGVIDLLRAHGWQASTILHSAARMDDYFEPPDAPHLGPLGVLTERTDVLFRKTTIPQDRA
jgi:FkbM family methyltransferase